jgi:hypothetical protein
VARGVESRVLALGAGLIFAVINLALSQAPNAPGRPARARLPSDAQPGPWDNDVLVYRVSADGEAQRLATFERAGVSTLARLKDGKTLAAFQHFPADDNRNFDRVAASVSNDEGKSWSTPRPIVVTGMEAGMARPFDPTLVSLPEGRIRLYFTSNRSPDFRRSIPAIFSAISSNGIDYAFEPGMRFGVSNRIVIDCAVAIHAGWFHLIVPDNGTAEEFAGQPHRGEPPRGGAGYHAVSQDGLRFVRTNDINLASSGRWLGALQSDDGHLVFFGTGSPGIWWATSAEGQSWKIKSSVRGVQGADPGAIKLRDGSWLLSVTGPPRSGTASAARIPRPPFREN